MYENEDSESERKAAAQTIFDTFVKGGSEQEINIDYDVRKEIRGKLDVAPKNLFAKAMEEVLSLLTMDIIPKFRSQYVNLFLSDHEVSPTYPHFCCIKALKLTFSVV